MTTTKSAIRPTLIRRVWDTGRVPFAFTPVTAATAVMTTARLSQMIQFIDAEFYKMHAMQLRAWQ